MRVPATAVAAGVVAIALGAGGLVLAAQSQGSGSHAASNAPPIVVTGAYVRPPVPPTETAAAYFTIRNTTDQPDVLQSVITGAGAQAALHTVQADGTMAVDVTGVPIASHATLALSPGKGHVMIEDLYGSLKAGQTVNIDLQFRDAGAIEVVAPVVPFGQQPSGVPTVASGGHS